MRIVVAATVLLFSIGAASADEVQSAFFVPSIGGEPAKVFYDGTDELGLVIGGKFDAPPQKCPSGAYWMTTKDTLVSCAGQIEFELAPLDPKSFAALSAQDRIKLAGVRKLVPVFTSGTETDEHPPMRKEPSQKGKRP
ncbi:hypothetical protein EN858_17540 [Mesorhizobium sp. M4B.F.Ca.ET.215.01.1.1]|uniref:hypothetical protein n=1 Tax=unclassified Mesorhizobium TaxID=325217 RepID=UPI000FCA4EEA|nr:MULTISPECIES: hypothetical protein [unclassified Mesorhizobium]RUW68613.1 hypothetical protein EOA31_25440 [Mesorhizobium sp. M4B.F.Ca.ET.049.02.1.2]TGQ10214.1 hypothetical protein EN858_17540 [Mesorhizobium sp. M4B.F.Ca.ET.215.01.1.1]TGQ34051.1 hypothetical protein EN863_033710 [Mesorhizobium sp. M00.F.Ca.ET.220.01.1.1]TGR02753.1 hypothetical protein EN846_16990 [Mesorhizobium sp. M4B.F.Ca.ET.203.01.1.1]TGV26005.1 hypothetical protein EN786_10675 [Mesorhizobium sp. M4B.F.Ca.ET.143.01.1.1]